jgi:hypothetical protein
VNPTANSYPLMAKNSTIQQRTAFGFWRQDKFVPFYLNRRIMRSRISLFRDWSPIKKPVFMVLFILIF